MVKNIGTPSLVERYGGRVDSPPMSHGVSVFSLGDYHGSKTKLSFGRRTQVRLATHAWRQRLGSVFYGHYVLHQGVHHKRNKRVNE